MGIVGGDINNTSFSSSNEERRISSAIDCVLL